MTRRGRAPAAHAPHAVATSRSTSCRRPVETVAGSMPSKPAMRRSPPHPHLVLQPEQTPLPFVEQTGEQHDSLPPASGQRPSPGVASSRRRARSCRGRARSAAQYRNWPASLCRLSRPSPTSLRRASCRRRHAAVGGLAEMSGLRTNDSIRVPTLENRTPSNESVELDPFVDRRDASSW